MSVQYDVIVIGAGVIGASVALELARAGRAVGVIDKGPGAGAGSTSSSSAIIRFSYSTPDAVLTAWESAACWREWDTHCGHTDPDGMVTFHQTGNLIFTTTGYDGAGTLKAWDDIGIPYETLTSTEIEARFSFLDVGRFYPPKSIDDPAFADDADGALGGFFNAQSGFIDDPMLAARNLAHAAKLEGAVFRYRSEVVAINTADGRVSGVDLAGGETLVAPVVINVGGPHSSQINVLAGVSDDMAIGHRPLRQEVFVAPAPAGFDIEQGTAPIIADLDLGQYIKAQLGNQILIGGTESECDGLEWIDDPDDYRDRPTVEGWETCMYRVARRMPDFGIPLKPTGLAALYDASDDWVPIYDKSSLPGFYMACGTSGNQFKNAPLAGKFMAALVEADERGVDHDLEPVHFTGAITGRAINLGSFSRNRALSETTGTVMG